MQNDLDNFQSEVISEQETSQEERPRFLRFLIDVVETLVLSVLLFAGINTISARIRVDGFSMEPTLHSGEFVIVNKLAYRFSSPQIGDVIVFHFPRDPDQEYIKRIIGLPGDEVQIVDGWVILNGKVLSEPYISSPPAYEATWSVPENALFVLGDNRNNSSDSHTWGPVPLDNVIGKAVFVYWPPGEWGTIPHHTAAFAAP